MREKEWFEIPYETNYEISKTNEVYEVREKETLQKITINENGDFDIPKRFNASEIYSYAKLKNTEQNREIIHLNTGKKYKDCSQICKELGIKKEKIIKICKKERNHTNGEMFTFCDSIPEGKLEKWIDFAKEFKKVVEYGQRVVLVLQNIITNKLEIISHNIQKTHKNKRIVFYKKEFFWNLYKMNNKGDK